MARISNSVTNNLPSVRRSRDAAPQTENKEAFDKNKYAPPRRPDQNYIPSPDVIRTLVERALEALARGIYWDRGSIIDIVL